MKLQSLLKILLVVVSLYLPQAVHADTIILRNEVLYGKILAETMSAFRFRLNCNGRIVFIRKAAIVDVRHNDRCGA